MLGKGADEQKRLLDSVTHLELNLKCELKITKISANPVPTQISNISKRWHLRKLGLELITSENQFTYSAYWTYPPGRNMNDQPSNKRGDTKPCTLWRNKKINIHSPIFLYTQFSEYNKYIYKHEEGKCDSEPRETIDRKQTCR